MLSQVYLSHVKYNRIYENSTETDYQKLNKKLILITGLYTDSNPKIRQIKKTQN